jgi:iron-sulfur cluster assembly protein
MSMSSPATDKQTPPPVTAQAVVGKKEIALTQAAADEIKRQRDKRGTPTARIRVGVRGGGCTGFTYVFEWADEPKPTDKEFKGPDGDLGIVVDPKSLVYLGGMTLDFVKGMMGHGFKFNNPNAKGACGCGESVQF